jgi:hypothetical protein
VPAWWPRLRPWQPLVGAISTPVLRLAGLSPSQVTPATGSATSSGHTISLIGASADAARTVVLVQVDGHDAPPSKTAAGYQLDATLTDTYGHSYSRIGGQTSDLWFEPLVGPAARGPANLTLHVSSLMLWPADSSGAPRTVTTVKGDWSIGLTVTRRPGVTVAIPAPVTVGDMTYTVTSIRVSGTEVTVNWTVTGGREIASLYQATRSGGFSPEWKTIGDRYFMGWILNTDGSSAGVPGNSDNGGYGVVSSQAVTGSVQHVLPGPGTYVLAIGRPAVVQFPITIPAERS